MKKSLDIWYHFSDLFTGELYIIWAIHFSNSNVSEEKFIRTIRESKLLRLVS